MALSAAYLVLDKVRTGFGFKVGSLKVVQGYSIWSLVNTPISTTVVIPNIAKPKITSVREMYSPRTFVTFQVSIAIMLSVVGISKKSLGIFSTIER